MDYRLETLHSLLPVFLSITASSQPFKDDKQLSNKIKNTHVKFQLYGYQDEIELLEIFIFAIENANSDEATESINKLIFLVKQRLREKLIYWKYSRTV
jgi:hypothetical protein